MSAHERAKEYLRSGPAISEVEHIESLLLYRIEQAYLAGYRAGHADGHVEATRRETPAELDPGLTSG